VPHPISHAETTKRLLRRRDLLSGAAVLAGCSALGPAANTFAAGVNKTPGIPLVLDSSTGIVTARGFSGPPEQLFASDYQAKQILNASAVLIETPHLFGYHSAQKRSSNPTGTHAGPTGVTGTGLTFDGTYFWLNNFGQTAEDGTDLATATVIKLDASWNKLAEYDLGSIFPGANKTDGVQGITYDASDGTLWIGADNWLLHMTSSGADAGGSMVFNRVNGVAYDSLRHALWVSVYYTLELVNKTTGAVIRSYDVPAKSANGGYDGLWYDAPRDYIWGTCGANGVIGFADAYKASDGTFVGTATFPDAKAIEGLVIRPDTGQFNIMHDGAYHHNEVTGSGYARNVRIDYSATRRAAAPTEWAAEYDASGNLLGYRIEPAFTRLNQSPTIFTNWSPTGCAVTSNTTLAPNRCMDADTLTASAGTGAARCSIVYTTATGVTYCGILVRAGTWPYFWMGDRNDGVKYTATFNLLTKTLVGKEAACTAGIEDWGGKFCFCWVRFTRVHDGKSSINIGFGTATHQADFPSATWAGTETLIVWGGHAGNAAMVGSPVFNDDFTMRAADALATPVTAWDWSSTVNSFKVAGRTPRNSVATVLAQIDDGSESNRIRLYRDASNAVRLVVTVSGSDVANLNLGTVANSTPFKVAARVAANDFAGSLNGAAVVTSGSAALPVVTTLRPGASSAGEQWGGHLKYLEIDPGALTNSALVAYAGS
jgi:hypothetical protein